MKVPKTYDSYESHNLCVECAMPKPPGGKKCPSCEDLGAMREDRSDEVMVFNPEI